MTSKRKYTTELSKGQGAIPEMLAVLDVWEPGMKVVDLKQSVLDSGVIARATALRVKDIVGRVFASRFLIDDGQPAINNRSCPGLVSWQQRLDCGRRAI